MRLLLREKNLLLINLLKCFDKNKNPKKVFMVRSEQLMRRLIIFSWLTTSAAAGFSQSSALYQKGLSAEENLKAIAGLAPYTQGGRGFDFRYEGIKGSGRMLDTLLPSFLRLKGQDYYIQIQTDLDLVNNSVIYIHPKTRLLYTISADVVAELIINRDGKELLFRTTKGKVFDKVLSEERFCQVLNDGQYQFIKIPYKTFVEADYKGAYSADRRYDEFVAKNKYYLLGTDLIFHQIQLNKKSLLKLYPDKKNIIIKAEGLEGDTDREEIIRSILSKF